MKRIAYLGIWTAVAAILGYVESLLPVFAGVPGIKLGLANLSILLLLKRRGWREASLVSLARILIIAFLFGNPAALLYSLAGAALSMAMMSLLLKRWGFGLISVSAAGGVFHNLGQIAAAAFLLRTPSLFYYLPPLMIAGIAAGLVIGLVTRELDKRLSPGLFS